MKLSSLEKRGDQEPKSSHSNETSPAQKGILSTMSRYRKVMALTLGAVGLTIGIGVAGKMGVDAMQHRKERQEEKNKRMSDEIAFDSYCLQQGGMLSVFVSSKQADQKIIMDAITILEYTDSEDFKWTETDQQAILAATGELPKTVDEREQMIMDLRRKLFQEPDTEYETLLRFFQEKKFDAIKYHFSPTLEAFFTDYRESNQVDLIQFHEEYQTSKIQLAKRERELQEYEKRRDQLLVLEKEYTMLEQSGKKDNKTTKRMKNIARAMNAWPEVNSVILALDNDIHNFKYNLEQLSKYEEVYQEAKTFYTSQNKGNPPPKTTPPPHRDRGSVHGNNPKHASYAVSQRYKQNPPNSQQQIRRNRPPKKI
jgi:hypothetical protein